MTEDRETIRLSQLAVAVRPAIVYRKCGVSAEGVMSEVMMVLDGKVYLSAPTVDTLIDKLRMTEFESRVAHLKVVEYRRE